VNEVQRVVCTADGGFFTLTFRQHTTSSIYYNAAASVDYVQLATVRIIFITDYSITLPDIVLHPFDNTFNT
jgi:hypothetical protein